jgi:hypothetical protein
MTELMPELRVVEYQNEWIVKSRFPFAYERHDTPQLAELRDRYRLDEVVAPGRSEWEQLLLLRDWVHSRWDHGWATADRNNALEVLARAEQGSDFACGYYMATLTQTALALGFQARCVGITKTATSWMAPDEGHIGHAVAEVWSQDWHKWVLLDADMNVHYEHHGLPLNALEIHRLWKSGRWQETRQVHGEAPFRYTTKPASGFGARFTPQHIATILGIVSRFRAMDFYAMIRWEMRNDFFSHREPVPSLRWFDETEPPQLVAYNEPITGDHWTCEERDAYWTLNQAQIDLRLASGDLSSPTVRVEIDHSMPNLDRTLVKLGDYGPWEPYRASFLWPIQAGKNVIEAKPISTFGREGYTSRIVLRYLGAHG